MIFFQNLVPLRQALTFSGVALVAWSFTTFPERSMQLRALSSLTLMAFFLLLGQFLCTRKSGRGSTAQSICNLFKLHSAIGYIALAVIMLHPLFLVLPKFGGTALTPQEALRMIMSQSNNPAIVAGIIAWLSLVAIGITSLFRRQLGFTYSLWRSVHTGLAVLFSLTAIYHVLHLSRHNTDIMSPFIICYAVYCCFVYFRGSSLQITPQRKNIEL